MAETVAPLLEHSIDIDASPAQVWALVTDIPRMAQWSPQVVKSKVSGGTVKEGARFTNLNKQGLLRWPTKGKVVTFTPHEEFAFKIVDNKSIWSFSLAPTASGGTTLTQRRQVPDGLTKASMLGIKLAMGGQESFTKRLNEGMQQTLERIKAEAEAA